MDVYLRSIRKLCTRPFFESIYAGGNIMVQLLYTMKLIVFIFLYL